MSLPPPELDFDFRMQVTLNPNMASVAVPGGLHKNIATFARGSWAGSVGGGTVVVCTRNSRPLGKHSGVAVSNCC